MTVNIDPSEVRAGTSPIAAAAKPRQRVPLRMMLLGGIGGVGLIAFTVGAFSFFSTLADPRTRTPRPMPAAASMPDLKDGLPVLVNGDGPAQSATTFNLPRPKTDEAAQAQTAPAEQAAATPSPAEPAPAERTASNDPQVPAMRTGTTLPPIQNAPTVPVARTVAIVAPPGRPVATVAPTRTETVKAKPIPVNAVASASPSRDSEPVAEPTSTATVAAPVAIHPPRKPVAAKPAVQKTAARKSPTAKTVADAEPVAAPAAAADDSDVPGARQFRAGVKAITGIFGGDKDE